MGIRKIIQRITNKDDAGNKRSSQWPKVRKAWLENHPTCAVCGGTSKIEVHHIIPFHLHPDLELVDSNFISLCEGAKGCNHHLLFGHFMNFKNYNPDVRKDAEHFNAGIVTKK